MTSERTYPAGVTSWVDVEVDDVAATREFYAGLFGWAGEQMTPPGIPTTYVVVRLDGQEVGGIGGPATPTGTPSGRWNTYVAVDDLEATLAAVESAGGRRTSEIDRAGEAGRSVRIADQEGLELCLWEAGYRQGAQVTNLPGAWNFSDLWSADPAGAQPFYEQVFGWVFADLGFATMIRVPGYGDHLAATVDPGIHERQSGIDAPPGFADAIGWLNRADEDTSPGWRVTFTVADRDASAALAESLGGVVVHTEDGDWTRTATLRDPQGAELVLSQFTPPSGG